jgi:uncharacterized protein (DUF58 family)
MKWLAAAAGLILLAWQFHLGLLVVASYAIAGLILLGRGLGQAWARQLSATRVCAAGTVEIGATFQVVVHLRNQGPFKPAWVLTEDGVPLASLSQTPPALKITGPWLAVMRLGRGETKTIQYTVQCLRRGYFQFGPLLVETGDLFGLHRTCRLLTEPHFVLVRPRALSLEGYDLESPRPLGEIRLVHRLFEDPTRISGVRAYQPGDPLSRVHWRATARTGELQCKTFESSAVAGATLLLDFHRDSYPPPGDYYASELAITLAATMARALSEMGQPFGLVSNGRDAAGRMRFQGWNLEFKSRQFARRGQHFEKENRRPAPVVVETRRGADQFDRILDALARLELTEELSLAELVRSAAARLPRSSTVAAIIRNPSPKTAATLGALRKRGYSILALVITIGEPEARDWAAPPEWASMLLREGVPFRAVADEAAVVSLCSQGAFQR